MRVFRLIAYSIISLSIKMSKTPQSIFLAFPIPIFEKQKIDVSVSGNLNINELYPQSPPSYQTHNIMFSHYFHLDFRSL